MNEPGEEPHAGRPDHWQSGLHFEMVRRDSPPPNDRSELALFVDGAGAQKNHQDGIEGCTGLVA